MQAGGVNIARAGGELGVLAHAVDRDVAGAGAGVEKSILRRLNLIVDADVVQVLVVAADADDVARLLDGRMSRDLAHLLVRCRSTPAGLDPAEDVHLVVRAAGEVNVARAGRDRQLYAPAHRQGAFECSLRAIAGTAAKASAAAAIQSLLHCDPFELQFSVVSCH